MIRTSAFLALAGILALGAASAPAAALPSAGTLTTPFPAPVSQVIEIDGRFIIVDLVVNRFIPGAPGPSNPSTTTVTVNLTAIDGAQLPAGLHAVGVRFEKLRGANRFFFTPVYELLTFAPTDGFAETDVHSFQGDLSDRASVQYMRAVIRLERDGEVIKAGMGIVHVQAVLAP